MNELTEKELDTMIKLVVMKIDFLSYENIKYKKNMTQNEIKELVLDGLIKYYKETPPELIEIE